MDSIYSIKIFKQITRNTHQTMKAGVTNGCIKEVYYTGGCFWGVEEYFSRVPGVHDLTRVMPTVILRIRP